MSLNTVFLLSFLPAAPFWFLMIVLPNWQWTRRIMRSPWVLLPAALLYSVFMIPHIGEAYRALGDLSLEAMAALFYTPTFALIAWLHFIAVDLVAGRWAYLDSQKLGIWPLPVAVTLFLIINMAPLGLLLYLGLRAVWLARQGEAAPEPKV